MLQVPAISPPCKYDVLYFRMYVEVYRCSVRTGIRFWVQTELRLQEIRFVPGPKPRWREGIRRCWYVLFLACISLYDAGLGTLACCINTFCFRYYAFMELICNSFPSSVSVAEITIKLNKLLYFRPSIHICFRRISLHPQVNNLNLPKPKLV